MFIFKISIQESNVNKTLSLSEVSKARNKLSSIAYIFFAYWKFIKCSGRAAICRRKRNCTAFKYLIPKASFAMCRVIAFIGRLPICFPFNELVSP